MQIGIEIASIWAAGILLGLALRATLPSHLGLGVTFKHVVIGMPLNRLAFWVCVMAGLILGGILIVKAVRRV